MKVLDMTLLFALFTLNMVSGQHDRYYGYSPNNYPNIRTESAMCGTQKSYVCDPDLILGREDTEASQLDRRIANIINETTCPCSAYSCEHHHEGYKIGIAVIKKMQIDHDGNSQEDDIDEGGATKKKIMKRVNTAQQYAEKIQKKWKLGRCDEDVIIFYSHDDNVVYTITGDVARMKLTNEIIASVAKEAHRTGFSNSPYAGLMKMVNDYRAVFLNTYHLREPKKEESKPRNFGSSLSRSHNSIVVMLTFALIGIYLFV